MRRRDGEMGSWSRGGRRDGTGCFAKVLLISSKGRQAASQKPHGQRQHCKRAATPPVEDGLSASSRRRQVTDCRRQRCSD